MSSPVEIETTRDAITTTARGSAFSRIAQDALRQLHARMGFGLWMLTRAEGEDWIVLAAEDHGYNLEPRSVFRWSDSICSRMVQELGPRIAPDAVKIQEYASAPIGKYTKIGAYIGIPLHRPDGSLFGTLCAIDPQPQPAAVIAELPFVEFAASMLSALLTREFDMADLARSHERLVEEAETDVLTGLHNRRGWNRLLGIEEERCRTFGHPGGILIIDLDGMKQVNGRDGHAEGDKLIRLATAIISPNHSRNDIVARLGVDEFGVLLMEANETECHKMGERIRNSLSQAGISAAIGMGIRDPTAGLIEAWERADSLMYMEKRGRSQSRGARDLFSLSAALGDDSGTHIEDGGSGVAYSTDRKQNM